MDNLNQDFVGSSQVASFAPGGNTVASVTFTVNDDEEPEIEETYVFSLTVMGSAHSVTVPNMVSVIIQANDDAYGVFSITDVRTPTSQKNGHIIVTGEKVWLDRGSNPRPFADRVNTLPLSYRANRSYHQQP